MTIPDVHFIGMVLNSNLVTGTLFYFIIHTNHFNGNDISVWTPESVKLSLIGYTNSSMQWYFMCTARGKVLGCLYVSIVVVTTRIIFKKFEYCDKF